MRPQRRRRRVQHAHARRDANVRHAEENRRHVLQIDFLRVDERLQALDAIEGAGVLQHQLIELALPVGRRRGTRGIPRVRAPELNQKSRFIAGSVSRISMRS